MTSGKLSTRLSSTKLSKDGRKLAGNPRRPAFYLGIEAVEKPVLNFQRINLMKVEHEMAILRKFWCCLG